MRSSFRLIANVSWFRERGHGVVVKSVHSPERQSALARKWRAIRDRMKDRPGFHTLARKGRTRVFDPGYKLTETP
ncbi:MAG TPA: hypothetical protein VK148_26910 [Xanthobacteraceae bacterium]|jgi:hypothetical protein|nr:hypothetical protein [Xanthobacteraceae bacterium]